MALLKAPPHFSLALVLNFFSPFSLFFKIFPNGHNSKFEIPTSPLPSVPRGALDQKGGFFEEDCLLYKQAPPASLYPFLGSSSFPCCAFLYDD